MVWAKRSLLTKDSGSTAEQNDKIALTDQNGQGPQVALNHTGLVLHAVNTTGMSLNITRSKQNPFYVKSTTFEQCRKIEKMLKYVCKKT